MITRHLYSTLPRKLGTMASLTLLLSFNCLPACHALVTAEKSSDSPEETVSEKAVRASVLEAGVSLNVQSRKKELLDDLISKALSRNDKSNHLDKRVKKYNRLHQKALALTKDALNYVFYYRGDSPSSEMGDVILNEKKKLKSRGSAEWLRQEHRDATEMAVLSNAMELAAAVGSPDDEENSQQLAKSMEELKQLVGEEAAGKALKNFKRWSSLIQENHPVYGGKIWSISQRKNKQKAIMMASKDTDPVIKDVVKAVHKYNGHSKLYLVTSRVVKTSLGVASMSPSFVAPASQVALFFYTMATGGAEEDKMLRELYLDKRLASRSRVIAEKSNLALEYYQIARLSKNPVLLAFCESVVKQMVGQKAVAEILGTSVLNEQVELACQDEDAAGGEVKQEISASASREKVEQAALVYGEQPLESDQSESDIIVVDQDSLDAPDSVPNKDANRIAESEAPATVH